METAQIDETVLSPEPKPKRIRTKDARIERDLKKYPILPPCNSKCRLSCSENMDSGLGQEIWKKSFKERRSFLNSNVNILV